MPQAEFVIIDGQVENFRWMLLDQEDLQESQPARLELLVPKQLAKIPQDLYSEAALQYRTTGTDYLLYSVGANQKDDDGQTFDSRPRGDDIVVSTRPPKRAAE